MEAYKFRIYDDENKKYIYFDFSDIDYNAIIIIGCNNKFYLNDYSKIEQYIGQGDINNTEIYEGDILLTDEANWKAKVIYNYDGFMLRGLNNKGFSCSPSYKNCEIIGNIHENKELLKE